MERRRRVLRGAHILTIGSGLDGVLLAAFGLLFLPCIGAAMVLAAGIRDLARFKGQA